MTQPISKHPGGRPTKYLPELLDKAYDYSINYSDYNDLVPTLAGLAHVIEVNKATIQEWISHKDKKEISVLCKSIMEQQERGLITNGLNGTYNHNITKLMLSKHGYTDQQGNQGVSVNISSDRALCGAVTVSAGDKDVTIEGEKE